MRARSLPLAGVLAVALLGAACSGDPGQGPLGNGDDGGSQCIPGPLGKPRAMGDFVLKNSGQTPVTVDAVTLTDDHGLAQGKPWLVPVIETQALIGVAYWPPDRTAWNRRIAADRAVVKPGEELNLVPEVWRIRNPSGVANITIRYSSSGTSYSLTEGWSVEVAHRCF